MKILVTGRHGQIARCLAEKAAARPDIELVATDRAQLDLCDPASVTLAIEQIRPAIVVSAAAYTAVDQAEDEPDRANAVNAVGAGALAAAAAAVEAAIIHLSTDYVFSGDRDGPYTESDQPDPQTVYGRSKLAGERAVALANPRHVILRTAWVYSPYGRNFVRTMLDLARQRATIRVVADQWGNPTSGLDIADAILRIADGIRDGKTDGRYGVFHLAGKGSTNWSGLARQVFDESRRLGGPAAEIEEIASRDYPARAQRPRSTRLSCDRLEHSFGFRAPQWQMSCRVVVARLLTENI